MKVIIDTSAWIKYFEDSNSETKKYLNNEIIIPSVILYELTKKLLEKHKINIVTSYLVNLQQFKIVDFDSKIAIAAGLLARKHNLSMADSIILTTADHLKCTIITYDTDFKPFKKVKLLK